MVDLWNVAECGVLRALRIDLALGVGLWCVRYAASTVVEEPLRALSCGAGLKIFDFDFDLRLRYRIAYPHRLSRDSHSIPIPNHRRPIPSGGVSGLHGQLGSCSWSPDGRPLASQSLSRALPSRHYGYHTVPSRDAGRRDQAVSFGGALATASTALANVASSPAMAVCASCCNSNLAVSCAS